MCIRDRAQRGLDEGLLQQLRDAGPESAATVAELVNASDAELAELSTVLDVYKRQPVARSKCPRSRRLPIPSTLPRRMITSRPVSYTHLTYTEYSTHWRSWSALVKHFEANNTDIRLKEESV